MLMASRYAIIRSFTLSLFHSQPRWIKTLSILYLIDPEPPI